MIVLKSVNLANHRTVDVGLCMHVKSTRYNQGRVTICGFSAREEQIYVTVHVHALIINLHEAYIGPIYKNAMQSSTGDISNYSNQYKWQCDTLKGRQNVFYADFKRNSLVIFT